MGDEMYRIRGSGPILLTSPHTVKTLRVDTIHLNETRVRHILEGLFDILGPDQCTLMIWNRDYFRENRVTPDDSNFVEDLHKSPWHNRLKRLIERGPRLPSGRKAPFLHFDLHGMRDDSTPHDIEFGMKSLEIARPLTYILLRHLVETYFRELGLDLGFDSQFQGWKQDQYTVTEQGTILGNTSIQIEMTHTLRERLYNEPKLLRRFAGAIYHIYARGIAKLSFPKAPTKSHPKRRRIGILSIPIYDKLRHRIQVGTSYVSSDYTEFVNKRLGADYVFIPYTCTPDEFRDRLRGVHAVIIPGGSYGNITNSAPSNEVILRQFINSFTLILEVLKQLHDDGHFIPMIGVCLGFQLLCLANSADTNGIVEDVRLKESGHIMRRLSNLHLCKCGIHERFEQVFSIHTPTGSKEPIRPTDSLDYYLFTNGRAIPYDEETPIPDIKVMTVYENKTGQKIISSVRHRKYPFVGFQFHPEKSLQVRAPYLKKFYHQLWNLVHRGVAPHVDELPNHPHVPHIDTYINKKNITYYIL